MKKYLPELIILLIQVIMFYLFPLTCGPTDAMGMVLILLIVSILLPIILMRISRNKIRFLYPVIVSIIFIPSVFIYYNESALIHAIWYLVTGYIGLVIGVIMDLIMRFIFKEK